MKVWSPVHAVVEVEFDASVDGLGGRDVETDSRYTIDVLVDVFLM